MNQSFSLWPATVEYVAKHISDSSSFCHSAMFQTFEQRFRFVLLEPEKKTHIIFLLAVEMKRCGRQLH